MVLLDLLQPKLHISKTIKKKYLSIRRKDYFKKTETTT